MGDAPNPDPEKFSVKELWQEGKHLVAHVVYHGCSNYEGRKVLLYLDTTKAALKKVRKLDPHFSANKKELSPFARFEPTQRGWDAAVELAKLL